MSSRKSASSRTAAEPSREEKAAFVRAMLKGIEPGTPAAEKTAAKRAGLVKGKSSSGKSSSGKSSSGKSSSGKSSTSKSSTSKGSTSKSSVTKSAAKTSAGKSEGKAAAKKAAAKKPSKMAGNVAAEPENRVEILRKISAPAPVETSAKSAEVIALAKEIEKALEKGDLEFLQPHAVQAMFEALVKFYGANDENGNVYPILTGRLAVTGTDAMVVCGALLRAVDLQVFELGMFQSWSGR